MRHAPADRDIVTAIGARFGREMLQGLRPWPSWMPRPTPSQHDPDLAARKRAAAKAAKRRARCERFLQQRFGLTRHVLYNLIWSTPVTHAAARFGLSDNALRKTCRRYSVPTPPRGYWRSKGAECGTKTFRRPRLPPL